MGLLADRFGATRLLLVGAAAGVIGNTFFAWGDTIGLLFFDQAFVAILVSSIHALGVTVAQDLYPHGVGYASSIYFSGLGLSAALGGILGSFGVAQLGMPGVFFVPALACALAGFGFYWLGLSQRNPQ